MSVSAMASLRPLQRQCLRHASSGLLSLHVRSPSVRFSIHAVIALAPQQRRHQSGSSREPEPPKPSKPPMSFTHFVRHALGASLRNLAVALSPRGIRAAYRDSPALIATIVALLIFTFGLSVIALRSFIHAFYNSDYSRYPKPIANTLRRAIYYTNIKPDPELALRFYRKAMEQSAELGLDPFSDEVLGIRIQVSFWLQKINSHKSAINVLESILGDCRKWVDVMEQSAKDGKVDDAGRYRAAPEAAPEASPQEPPQASPESSPESSPATQPDEAALNVPHAEPETLWRKRQRLLAKAIGTSVKLGELYSDEHVLDPDKSHTHLLWAVETALREFQRRKSQGLKSGEQDWLTPEELGGSMESLGRDYERKSQFQLAIPLFFQALRLCESPCHRAVIMNNISAAFAQHPIYTPPQLGVSKTLQDVVDPATPKTRNECLDAALNWARNAYSHAQDVKGDTRTPECDEACAVALCNWGDVAAMLGKADVARAKYKECIDMSRQMEFPQGLKQAQEGLAKLTSTSSSRI
ncbi:TPR domain-containing protein [Hirsutella rhossiliensis]|uniref:TPR domain-containing protein n=1 Tax=Hirsutella rhossiliensis TaxID=111463 RepID=A0A9P8MWZ8_9HYPO|nr:TPR domain-containing protein [Hirsutella rhossiliensis]KAH0961934.1 TPR domain-containing protein [Hirsutella rhossiliensis]